MSERTKETERQNDSNTSEEAVLPPELQRNFTCTICTLYLCDPVLTICGHRFCRKCLSDWRRNHADECPVDYYRLTEVDIFPLNYVKQEIARLSLLRPNNDEKSIPSNLLYEFIFRPRPNQDQKGSCSFAEVGCNFKHPDPTELSNHNANNVIQHTRLLLKEIKSNYLLRKRYEYVNILLRYVNNIQTQMAGEIQISREQVVQINYDTDELNQCLTAMGALPVKMPPIQESTDGKLYWEIENFPEVKKRLLRGCNEFSSPFYASEPGYRFKMRLSIPAGSNSLAVHVHLVPGLYDDILQWPLVGEVAITVVHPTVRGMFRESKSKTRVSEAFKRPRSHINERGFGFHNTVTIDELSDYEYVKDNQLVISGYVKTAQGAII